MFYESELIRYEKDLLSDRAQSDPHALLLNIIEIHNGLIAAGKSGILALAESLQRICILMKPYLRSSDIDEDLAIAIVETFPIGREVSEDILYCDVASHRISNALISNITSQVGFFEEPEPRAFSSIMVHLHESQNWSALIEFLNMAKNKESFEDGNVTHALHSYIGSDYPEDNNEVKQWFIDNQDLYRYSTHYYSGYSLKSAFELKELGYGDLARSIARDVGHKSNGWELIQRQNTFGINLEEREIFDYCGQRKIDDESLVNYLLFCKEGCDHLQLSKLSFNSWPTWNDDKISEVDDNRYQQVVSFFAEHNSSVSALYKLERQVREHKPELAQSLMRQTLMSSLPHFADDLTALVQWWELARQYLNPDQVEPHAAIFTAAIEAGNCHLMYERIQVLMTDVEGLQRFVDPALLARKIDESWSNAPKSVHMHLQRNVPKSIAQLSNCLQRVRLEQDFDL
jgi:hypothetical protein